eukprot:59930-Chlamydomonas_euryale.AAC.2
MVEAIAASMQGYVVAVIKWSKQLQQACRMGNFGCSTFSSRLKLALVASRKMQVMNAAGPHKKWVSAEGIGEEGVIREHRRGGCHKGLLPPPVPRR